MKRLTKTLFMMAMVIITAFGITNTAFAAPYDYNNYEIDPEFGYIIVNTVDNTKTQDMACVNLYVYDLPKNETKAAKRQGFFMTFDCLTPDIFPKGEYYNEDDPLFFLEFKNANNPGEDIDTYKNLTGDLHLYRMYLEPGQYCFQYYQFYENKFLTQNYGSCYDKSNFDKNNRDVWDITADKVYTLYCLNAPSKELYEAHYDEYAAFAKANDSYRFGEDNNGEYSEQQLADIPTFEDYKNQGVDNSFTIDDIVEETQDANVKSVSLKDIERMFEGSGVDLDAKYIGGGAKLPEKYYETHDVGTNRLVIWERLNGYSISWDDLEGDKEPLNIKVVSVYRYLTENGYVKEDTEEFYEALLTLQEFAEQNDTAISKEDIENIFEGVDITLTPETLINIAIRTTGKTSVNYKAFEDKVKSYNGDEIPWNKVFRTDKGKVDNRYEDFVVNLEDGMDMGEVIDYYGLDATEYSDPALRNDYIRLDHNDKIEKDYELLAYKIRATIIACYAYDECTQMVAAANYHEPFIYNAETVTKIEKMLLPGFEHFYIDADIDTSKKSTSSFDKGDTSEVSDNDDTKTTSDDTEVVETVKEEDAVEEDAEEKKPISPIIFIIGIAAIIGGIVWGQIAKRR